MARGLRRFFQLAVPAVLVVLLLASSLTHASATIVAMASDSAVGKNSLAMPGSQDILKDPLGKYVAVYADAGGNLSVVWANGDLDGERLGGGEEQPRDAREPRHPQGPARKVRGRLRGRRRKSLGRLGERRSRWRATRRWGRTASRCPGAKTSSRTRSESTWPSTRTPAEISRSSGRTAIPRSRGLGARRPSHRRPSRRTEGRRRSSRPRSRCESSRKEDPQRGTWSTCR